MSLAKNIVLARQKAGLSQAELAKKLKKSRSSLCEYESGDHDPPLTVLRRIARVTGVQLAELVA